MAAGFKYNLEPEVEQEERYDVETGRRRRGPYKLDTTNLVVGSYLPSFTPIAADLVKKTSQVAIRVEVYEKFTTGSNTTLKIKKRSLAYKGMHLGNGAHGATINAIDKADKAFDKLTLAADFGENLEALKYSIPTGKQFICKSASITFFRSSCKSSYVELTNT